jgi:hypothetical protein
MLETSLEGKEVPGVSLYLVCQLTKGGGVVPIVKL